MAHSVDVKNTGSFCDEVFVELSSMKKKMSELRDYAHSRGGDNEVIGMYERHLAELIDEIDWKIQILAHSCPHDWKGAGEFENDVQVEASDTSRDKEFSPGYIGG